MTTAQRAETIRWCAIRDIGVLQYQRQRLKVLDVDSPAEASLSSRPSLCGRAVQTARSTLMVYDGATLKATTVLAMMNWLGIKASHSRPRVSDDNAFVESLARTAKYRRELRGKGYADLDQARQWASPGSTGTTRITAIAASATSARRSAMLGRIARSR